MTEEAREAARRIVFESHGQCDSERTDRIMELFDAGVREGIRQAREAVVAVNGRGMDNYLGRALEAIDALEAEK